MYFRLFLQLFVFAPYLLLLMLQHLCLQNPNIRETLGLPREKVVHDVCSSGLNGSSIMYIGPMSCGPILVG